MSEYCDYCGKRLEEKYNDRGERLLTTCNHVSDGSSLEEFNDRQMRENPYWCTIHDRWKDGRDKDCP